MLVKDRGGQPEELPHVRRQSEHESRLSSTSQTHGNNISHCLTESSRRFLLLEEAPCASDTVVTPVM